jgi:hypothetical protein
MIVRPITSEEFQTYGDKTNQSYFGSASWMLMHGDSVLPLGVFGKKAMIGTLLLFRYTKMSKEFLIHPPLSPHCGLTVELTAEKRSTRQGQVKNVLNALASYLSEHHKSAYIDFCLPEEFQDSQPFQWLKFEVSPKHSYRLNLDRSEEELMAEMSTERRKNIKKGKDKGYQLEWNGDATKVLDLLMITVEKASLPNNALVLKNLLSSEKQNYFTNLLSIQNKPAAANVIVFDSTTAYYFAGGYDASLSDSDAGTFALWSSILKAKELGCQSFDFLGSSIPDIERYFRGFGAELMAYPRITQRRGLVAWLKRRKEESR